MSPDEELALAAEANRDWHKALRIWRAIWRMTAGEREVMRIVSHMDLCVSELRAPVDPPHGCAGEVCRTVGCSRRAVIEPPYRTMYPQYASHIDDYDHLAL